MLAICLVKWLCWVFETQERKKERRSRGIAGLVSNLSHPQVNKTKQHYQWGPLKALLTKYLKCDARASSCCQKRWWTAPLAWRGALFWTKGKIGNMYLRMSTQKSIHVSSYGIVRHFVWHNLKFRLTRVLTFRSTRWSHNLLDTSRKIFFLALFAPFFWNRTRFQLFFLKSDKVYFGISWVCAP